MAIMSDDHAILPKQVKESMADHGLWRLENARTTAHLTLDFVVTLYFMFDYSIWNAERMDSLFRIAISKYQNEKSEYYRNSIARSLMLVLNTDTRITQQMLKAIDILAKDYEYARKKKEMIDATRISLVKGKTRNNPSLFAGPSDKTTHS